MLRNTLVFAAAISIALPMRAQPARDLTAAQLAEVNRGGQLFLTWDVVGSPWPRTCVIQFINAAPEEAAAVFANYPRHTAFIPGVRKAVISRVIDAATTEVDYTLAVPIVADEDYTVRDHVSSADDGASYRIEWTLVRATSTKATEGNVRFERHHSAAHDGGGTLMSYCNLVTPGSSLARLRFVRSRALAQVRETARAVVIEVERQRASDRALLATELRALHASLAATTAAPPGDARP